MKIPYNRVHVRGQFIFAARGGSIHSFRLADGSHVATWKHPDVDKVASVVKANAEILIAEANKVEQGEGEEQQQQQQQQQDSEEGPPTKRQRVHEAAGESEEATAAAAVAATGTTATTTTTTAATSTTTTTETTTAADAEQAPAAAQDGKQKHFEGRGKRKKGKGKGEEVGWGRLARVPDRPVVTHLTSSADGRHLLAITGHDKVIWVLAHDGAGRLAELSRRTMPKRPSAVALAPEAQIVCADKFGDVYALPLLVAADTNADADAEMGSGSGASTPTPLSALPLPSKKAFKPSANTFTVHSKGNRKALENQILQAELERQTGNDGKSNNSISISNSNNNNAKGADGPAFELNLLLGHVSMLTSLVLGEAHGRRYILTADRDEHVRVSRYMPQAHIIEAFCMGHKEFVSEMLIPPAAPGLLVSGGGDDSLFLWDWPAGKLLSRAGVLPLAQQVSPEATKVAVSGLYSLVYPSEEGPLTYVLAICEDIKAIFSWHLAPDNTLNRPGIIQIPGNPIHLTIAPSPAASGPPTLIAAIDPDKDTPARSLHVFALTIDDGRLAVGAESTVHDHALEVLEADISEDEVRQLLYTIESLRKISTSWLHANDEEQDRRKNRPRGISRATLPPRSRRNSTFHRRAPSSLC
ncbi:tRNA (guanine-N(7)-)-methyltransferase non-catalytic subunit trm82 [Escovopsis weberi]|uniref:tRNA (Guanine-N(7)-)-methyltransferase non-catalytic subunit trm82 n=1 Tax=Escovopsis weberi TaxID=150374 RepID=A0A0M8MT62_ESCWE|nr:tRNA (guanine-N(7)-)-methyltransferase non-catalytic subunit trm82 [Escovopsis weberi]